MARGLPLNPISVGSGMTYLTFLYHRGLRWRSFDISRSAVSQTLPKWMVSPLGVAPVWFILWRASSTNAHLLVAASLCGIQTTFSDLSPLGLDLFLSALSSSGRPSWLLLQLVVDYPNWFPFVWTTTSSFCRTFLLDSSLHVSARRIGLITWARQSCFIHFRRIQLCVLWRLCRLSSRCATASDYRIHICSSPRCVHLRLYPSPHFVVSSPGCCARRTSTPPLAPPVPLLHLQHSLEERRLRTSSARVIGLVLRLSSLIIVVMLVPVPRPHVAPPAARPSCAYCMIPPAMGMQTRLIGRGG